MDASKDSKFSEKLSKLWEEYNIAEIALAEAGVEWLKIWLKLSKARAELAKVNKEDKE